VNRPSLRDARILVLGLGRFGGGLGVARWLLSQGAEVTVTDRAPREALAESAALLEAEGARLVLGGHEGVDLGTADLLVVNPAVPMEAPLVRQAAARGVAITSEIALLMERWPGPLVGVTGSNGKSTTVGLVRVLLEAAGRPAVAGGNLGGSLLDRLDQAASGTVAVLELSSYMLELLPRLGLGPEVALILNLTPNHLDRHRTMEAYRDAKAGIFARARSVVLPAGDAWLAPLAQRLDPQVAVRWFGDRSTLGPEVGFDLGLDLAANVCDGQGRVRLASAGVPLPGRMNRLDVAAAALTAGALLGDLERVLAVAPTGLAAYRAPPHRLQHVGRRAGVAWIDDSVSTTPESTAASLEAIGGGCILIAGGRDKGLDATALVAAARVWARHVLTVGELGPVLAAALNRAGVAAEEVGTVPSAVRRAAQLARAGDTVLLSPGYSSHDQFVHFEERGRVFAAEVAGLPALRPLSQPSAEC